MSKSHLTLPRTTRVIIACIAIGLLGVNQQADASIITSISVESVIQGNNFGFGPERLLNSTFMSDNPATVTSTLAPAVEGWLSQKSASDPFPELVLNLGATYDVDKLILWGWNQDNVQDRTWKDFTIAFSTDNVSFGTATQLLMSIPTGNGLAEAAHSFDVGGVDGSSNAHYVRLKALTIFGGNSFDNTPIFGMGKLRFDGSEPVQATVPEPASLSIWCGIGIAGLVAGLRRKRCFP